MFARARRRSWVPTLGWDRPPGVGELGVALQAVVEKSEHAFVVVEPERPVEHLAGGVDDADPLRFDPGPADLAVEPAFRTVGGVIDQAGLEGHGHEPRIDAADDVGIGEDRLTGGAGVPSAAGIVGGPVDEDPEQGGLVGFA